MTWYIIALHSKRLARRLSTTAYTFRITPAGRVGPITNARVEGRGRSVLVTVNLHGDGRAKVEAHTSTRSGMC